MRILVIEDEHRIANSIKKGLEFERYAVDVAYDGVSGYDLAVGEKYDLILLDLMLPGKDGVRICRDLRSEKIHTPILMLTAKNQVIDRVSGLDSGADDYLVKPFSFAELVARIRALTRRSNAIVGPVLSAGDLELDPRSFRVTRSGQEVRLSSKEFSILEYLLRNKGAILSKDQIIVHVWDYDSDILTNTVEVNMRNLRRKIEVPFPHKKPLIETVRGFGYRIGV
jgi:DNA-binding response OmpR family regulator